jgi:four helix bundle protein
MNDPEVTMLDALPASTLIAHRRALEAAALAIQLVMRVAGPLRSLADQVIRSASSVPADLSEGHGRSGRDRMHHWRIAYGSAKEVDSHLRLLAEADAVEAGRADSALQLFDEVRAMTWRLLHPQSRFSAATTPAPRGSLSLWPSSAADPCPLPLPLIRDRARRRRRTRTGTRGAGGF